MFFLHATFPKRYFSKKSQLAIIKASRESDKQKEKNKHEITDFGS
jgi:hypothetical protein